MKRRQVVLLHITFWAIWVLSTSYSKFIAGRFFSLHNDAPGFALYMKYLLIEAGYNLIVVSCFYGSYLFTGPQLFVRKSYSKAITYTLLILAFIILLRYALEYGFFAPVLGFDNYRGHKWPLYDFAENVVLYYFPSYFVYGIIYFFVENWYKTTRRQQELEKEKLSTELAFLRSQVNPHFLFNTINDIYSLTYMQSPQAPNALLKLSAILRYMLREGNEDQMPLEREAEYLENVIELQRIGSKGNSYINFTQEGYIGTQPIAPLLLIAFVENAFKHGILTDAWRPVNIILKADHHIIDFRVQNFKNDHLKDDTGGIGLNNVRRRLQLVYPQNHKLNINETDTEYAVHLLLNLSE